MTQAPASLIANSAERHTTAAKADVRLRAYHPFSGDFTSKAVLLRFVVMVRQGLAWSERAPVRG